VHHFYEYTFNPNSGLANPISGLAFDTRRAFATRNPPSQGKVTTRVPTFRLEMGGNIVSVKICHGAQGR
jgi:hypothetical protein